MSKRTKSLTLRGWMTAICLAGGVFLLPAQSVQLERSILASAGTHESAGGMILTATVGDLVITTAVTQNGVIVLTQGYQQGALVKVGLEKVEEWMVHYNIFPNPTPEVLKVELEVNKPVTLKFQVYDMIGKETNIPVQTHQVMGSYLVEIDLTPLPEGRYLLAMQDEDGHTLKTFKLEKVN